MEAVRDSYADVFGDKHRVFVVTAHPDDNEVVCGGLVARLIADGKQVRLVVTTNGEKGVEDKSIAPVEFAAVRVREQAAAAKALGIAADQTFNLGIPDGELEASVENIGRVVRHIREFRPDIIITHNPDETINTFSSHEGVYWVNHRDHRHTAQITLDALYPYSRDRAFFPEQLKEGLQTHTVTEVLLSDSYEYSQRRYFDVTDFVDKKRQALASCPSVIPADHVEGYIDELKIGNRYYEQLRYVKGLY